MSVLLDETGEQIGSLSGFVLLQRHVSLRGCRSPMPSSRHQPPDPMSASPSLKIILAGLQLSRLQLCVHAPMAEACQRCAVYLELIVVAPA